MNFITRIILLRFVLKSSLGLNRPHSPECAPTVLLDIRQLIFVYSCLCLCQEEGISQFTKTKQPTLHKHPLRYLPRVRRVASAKLFSLSSSSLVSIFKLAVNEFRHEIPMFHLFSALCILVVHFIIKTEFHYLPESVAIIFLGTSSLPFSLMS